MVFGQDSGPETDHFVFNAEILDNKRLLLVQLGVELGDLRYRFLFARCQLSLQLSLLFLRSHLHLFQLLVLEDELLLELHEDLRRAILRGIDFKSLFACIFEVLLEHCDFALQFFDLTLVIASNACHFICVFR